MAESPQESSGPLDVERIHYLARLMKRYDLSSLDLADGPVQIRLRRRGPEASPSSMGPLPQGGSQVMVGNQPYLVYSMAQGTAPHPGEIHPSSAPATPGAASLASAPSAPAEKGVLIESPMVGTYYTSRAPDAPPLVTVGTVVHPGTIVCIIEAMKVFTDIPAGVSGTIVEVLAKNGQAVEFGQPLFRVNPS